MLRIAHLPSRQRSCHSINRAVTRRWQTQKTTPLTYDSMKPIPQVTTLPDITFGTRISSNTQSRTVVPDKPPTPLLPIILPPMTSRIDHPSWRGQRPLSLTALQEQLSVVYALIQAHKISRAEKIFHSLRVSNRDDMRLVCDTHVYNVFIDAYMELISPDRTESDNTKALKDGIIWFQKLKREDLTPDATSYAAVIRGLLKTQNDDEVHLYLTELLERSCESSTELSITNNSYGVVTVVLKPNSILEAVMHHPYLRHGLPINLQAKFCQMLTSRSIPLPTVYEAVVREIARPGVTDSEVPLDVINSEIDNFYSKKQELLTALSSQKNDNTTLPVALEADSEGLPQAISVPSMGMLHLKQNLSVLTKNPHLMQPDAQNKFALYTLQLKLEEEAYSVALERLKEEITAMSSTAAGHDSYGLILGSRNRSLKKYMWKWYEDLKVSIEKEIEQIEAGSKINDRLTYGPMLQLLSPSKLAMITILELLRLHHPTASLGSQTVSGNPAQVDMFSDSTKVNKAVVTIGAAVESEINAVSIQRKRVVLLRQRSPPSANPVATAPSESSQPDSSATANNIDSQETSPIVDKMTTQDTVEKDKGAETSRSMNDWLISYLNERLYTNQRLFNMTIRKLYKNLQAEQTGEKEMDDLIEPNTTVEEPEPGGETKSWLQMWPQSMRAKVGSVLLSLLLDVAKVEQITTQPETGAHRTDFQAAFYHSYTYQRGKRLGVIKYHTQVSELLSRDPLRVTLHPKMLPMLVRPRPWLTYMSGGYLTSRSACMRYKDRNPEQIAYLRAAAKNNHLDYILATLDVLGCTPWRINKDVFKVVLDAWNSGEAVADIPEAFDTEKELRVQPVKPSDYDTNSQARREHQRKLIEVNNRIRNSYSLRCDTNYKIEIARTYLGCEIFFPHNIDFRGRAYPMPVHLNHISSDLCRGLLTFSEVKPLEERGWYWLRVHLANLYGFDKQSFSDRVQWVDDNMDNIIDSIERPLNGKRWWLRADDPWQCLATSFEIVKAVRSGNPLTYASSLPVHQDGTCNGLQHYAALGGDISGAKQVNLIVGDKPSDVYSAVAELVSKEVSTDAALGNKHAKLLEGLITRKIVKQTVMTNVYGVTFVGARMQIQNRLKETKTFDDHIVWQLSTYLARKVFNSLGEMFSGAQSIQSWLNEAARRVAKSVPADLILPENIHDPHGKLRSSERWSSDGRTSSIGDVREKFKTTPAMTSVIWTTPLSLPCVQPYRRDHKTQVKTLLQTIHLTDPNHPAPVNVMKQRSAFPPNFIHSLDASHMMMTAISCHHQGLSFASVHDSYWTHPADVDRMNTIIRDEFINLHGQSIMSNLVNEFSIRYANYVVPSDVINDKQTVKSKRITVKNKAKSRGVVVELVTVEDDTLDSQPLSSDDMALDMMMEDDMEEAEDISHSSSTNSSNMWVPLELPPLPARGEFDVQHVKESPYFFH